MKEIENRKAKHDYFILDTLECGIELKGHEVKSIKKGACNIIDSYCTVTKNNELFVTGMHITKYDNAFDFGINEKRDVKLLARKAEIIKLGRSINEDGKTLIPLKIYLKNGRCKMLIGICKGKHNYDKRQTLKERDIQRDMERNR